MSLDALHDGMKNELLWVAVESNDSPVGFILLSVLDAIIFIKEMDVHRHHQQQGFGKSVNKHRLSSRPATRF
ncbi:MAG: GNAT family N-acetyltransferase [Proteobacteria bacterium]|nr:GNAT family N-acetyltransferase [Pseudomonadota bacterium]